jgi:dephospho-CoA kinase
MSRVPGDSPAADARPEFDSRPDTADASSHLRDRLERLPPGHPSSPYEADGRRRESAPLLRDLDTGTDDGAFAGDSDVAGGDSSDWRADDNQQADAGYRFTDAEWSEHRAETRALLGGANAADMASYRQYTVDPDNQAWTAERRSAHDLIINSIYAEARDVPNDRAAIIAGGMCGAGKTTVLNEYASIDRSQYLTISPDDIKEQLARRGLIPETNGLSPMEASDLVHRESSYIAHQLALRARADGKNHIWDITMSSLDSTQDRINDLREAGYERVEAIFVHIPVGVSLQRADARHREGEEKYRSGVGLGGRYVPPEAITSQADDEWGSKNRRAFEELKPRFDRWTQYDNSVDGRKPVRVEAGSPDDSPERSIS